MTDHSYAEGRYAVFIIMLNVVIQSVDMLNVFMLSVEVSQIWRYGTTFSKNDTQHNDIQHNDRALLHRVSFLLSVTYAECHILAP